MIIRLWLLLCLGLMVPWAGAQEWPARTVRMVVPWPAGGGTDIAARPLAARMSELTGQQFIIDNRGGANGIIGADLVAKSPGDGYTILMHTLSSHVLNTSYFRKLPYNPEKDFSPVTFAGGVPLLLYVHPSFPARNVRDVVAAARARPGEVQYASFAPGSPSHFAGALLALKSGTKMTHVPYKGGGPAMIALVSGEAYLHFGGSGVGLPHVKAGKIRAIAVSSAERSPQAPELPTVGEALGIADYDASVTFGLLLPSSAPQALRDRIYKSYAAALQSPEFKARLRALSTDERPVITPQELAEWLKKETARWAEIVKATGIRGE